MNIYVMVLNMDGEIFSLEGTFRSLKKAQKKAREQGSCMGAGRWSKWEIGETGPGTIFWNTRKGNKSFTIYQTKLR